MEDTFDHEITIKIKIETNSASLTRHEVVERITEAIVEAGLDEDPIDYSHTRVYDVISIEEL